MDEAALLYVSGERRTYEESDTAAYHNKPGILIPVAKARERAMKRVVGKSPLLE